MKHPLLPLALCYLCGVLAGHWVEINLAPAFGATALLLLLTLLVGTRMPWFMGLTVLLLGWTNLTWQRAILDPADLRTLVAERALLANIRGTLAATPLERIYGDADQSYARTVVRLQAESMQQPDEPWQPARGAVMVSLRGSAPTNVFRGSRVELFGVIAPPSGPAAPGLFDHAQWLARQGIFYELRVEGAHDWRTLESPDRPPWTARFRDWARQALARGLPVEDEPLHLLWAMVLGWKTALTGQVAQPFMQSGTMHLFAISGLHVALIAGILLVLGKALQIPRTARAALILPLIWAYAAITEWQPSAVRSTVMMSVIIGGWSLRRPPQLMNSLAAAGLALLLWDPQQLFQASFQLSFIVVVCLALSLPVLEACRARWVRGDPLLPEELRPWHQRLILATGNRMAKAFLISLAAWLGSLPLIALYFNLFTPVALLANLVVVPLGGAALTSALASLITAPWCSWLNETFNHAAWFFMNAMAYCSRQAAQWPLAHYYVRAPHASEIFLHYTLLLTIFLGWWQGGRARRFAGLALGILLCAAGWHWWERQRTTVVSVLPLRGGHCILVEPAGAKAFLIDCGDAVAAERIVAPYLHSRGLNRLDLLLITHGDVHQMGGAEFLDQMFAVRSVAVGAAPGRSPAYQQFLSYLKARDQSPARLQDGNTVRGWTVLHPSSQGRPLPEADDNAVVLFRNVDGRRTLLSSDLGHAGQMTLAARQPQLKVDLVVSGLPRRDAPLEENWLAQLEPRLIILADAAQPATRRAPPALQLRLAQHRRQVVATSLHGGLQLQFKDGHLRVRSAREELYRD